MEKERKTGLVFKIINIAILYVAFKKYKKANDPYREF
jgi:hypothetical protein